jgi:hypothetical protein
MTEYPAEADTQPTDPQPAPTDQPAETGPELPDDQRIPDDEAALLTEDPTAPNPYTDDEDGDS